jgi:polyphosphate:AMP phosphotransferase
MRPFLWNYWIKTPSKGTMTIFDKSWHRSILPEQQAKRTLSHTVRKDFRNDSFYYDVEAFERQLSEDGTLIIKFFLHISKAEQKKRLDSLMKNPNTQWRVKEHDIAQNKNYDMYLNYFGNMISQSSFAFDCRSGEWNIIESEDANHAAVKIYKIIIDRIEGRINAPAKPAAPDIPQQRAVSVPAAPRILSSVNPAKDMDKDEYKDKLKYYQGRLANIEYKLYIKRRPVVIVYEGADSAGKGGNIRRLTQELDPRGYEVTPVAAPTREELAHHYLWRFWKAAPKDGHIAIFDRSWYGRVLVERVEGFCSETEWRRAYKEINDMEKHLHNHGAVIFKFWIHIDKDEQLARFREREADPLKQYKMTDEDWRNREKWEAYEEAADEMLALTSTDYAPWTVVEGNNKRYARIKTLRIVTDTLEKQLK